MKKISFLLIFFLLSVNIIVAQTSKFDLSRQDSAKITSYLQQAQEYKSKSYLKQESDCYNNIATIWWEHNYFGKAAEYYNKSLGINKKLGNANGIAMINSNLALIYADKGDYSDALNFFDKTLSIRKARNEKIGTIAAHINMSVVLNNLKRYDESVSHLNEALDIAREMSDYTQMRSCYGMLSETYEKAGDYKKSMYYFGLYRDFNELVEGKKINKAYKYAKEQKLQKELIEKEKKIQELKLIKKNYDLIKTGKKLKKTQSRNLSLLDTITEKELKLEYIKNQKKLEEIKNQKIILESKLVIRNIILISSIILLLLFLFIFFYIQKQKSNKKLQIKNIEITQKNEEIQVQKNNIEELLIKTTEAHESIKKSIDYAGIIQTAMINKSPKLSDFFPESFILYKAKDIVGGDFYWYSKINNKIIVAAIDCTGHGVPGAFLTVLGNNILNQLVTVQKITDPGLILEKMNIIVKETLNQEKSNNKDGMDMAICTIDYENQKLYFAGANNPLLLINNDEMNIVKGEKYGIGGFSNMLYEKFKLINKKTSMYQTHNINYAKDTAIYLFSDGFQDQINTETNKRISSRKFYQLLKENSHLPMKKQKEILYDFLNKIKGDNEQVDDILIIGIKL